MSGKWLSVCAIAALALLLFGCFGGDLSPSGVAAAPAVGGIQVSWNPMSGVAGYNVYRSTEAGNAGGKINPSLIVGEASYKDTSVVDGTTYYYTVKSVDSGGKEYGAMQASATARLQPPRGLSITINSGANYTTHASVALALSAVGAQECRLSNDGLSWGDWQPYADQRSWDLSAGDGAKQVYYTCRDDVGNIAQPVSASITLTTTGPVFNVKSPVQGGQYAGGFDLIFSINDQIATKATCLARLDGQQLDMGVVDVGVEYNFTIPAAPGTHTLYGECDDGVLKSNKSATFTVIDKPGVRIALADGSGYTDRKDITVDVNATLATECRFSNDGITWGGWTAYAETMRWQLTAGDGDKTVYAQCKSSTGVVSDTVSDTITLDTTPPPYISIQINNGVTRVNTRQVTLGLYAFAADKCKFANDNLNSWGTWEAYTTRKSWTLSTGNGQKTVYYDCRKVGGDDLGTASASVSLFEVPPGPPTNLDITINSGDTYTSSRTVNLRLYAQGASECRFGNNNYGWTMWEDYTTYETYVLPTGDGQKTLYYQCRNDYGTASAYSTIYLESGPPTSMSMVINNGAQYTSSRYVTLALYAQRANQCQYREEGGSWSSWESYATARGFTLSSGAGQKVLYYQCRNSGGISATSASIYLETGPLPPITDLSASVVGAYVYLTWSPPDRSGRVSYYKIMRSTEGFGLITEIGTSRTASFTDRQVSPGETYNYWVRAVDSSGQETADSNMASVTFGPVATPTETPTPLVETPTPSPEPSPTESPTAGPLGG